MIRRIAILAAALVCALPATAYASLGKTTVGNFTDNPGDASTGSGQDWRAIAATSETVNRLNVYLLSGTTGHPEIGLYDSAKAKKGSCTISAPVVGWNRCSIPNVSITSGSTYWLAILRPQGQGVVNFSNASGTGTTFASYSSSLSALPATWVNGASYAAQTASLYADSSTPPVDATPPTASFTAPTAGQTVSGTVNVAANASDNTGGSGMWFVAFRVDDPASAPVNVDYSSPYGFALDTTTLTDGQHTLYARPEDNAQNIGSDATVTFTVNNAPPPPTGVTWSNGWGTWDAGNWPDASWRPYADDAPINSKYGESTTYVANDAAMVSRARNAHAVQETWATTGANDWYHPYYFNHASDPLYTVHCTTYACPTMEGLQLRIPNAARPAGGGDAHMAVLDQASNYEWDFYHAPVPSGSGGTYNVGGGGRLLVSGNGIVGGGPSNQSGATAANLGLLAGPVRPEELSAAASAGKAVPHALYMVIYCTSGQHVFPATGNARACSSVGQSNTDAPADGQLFKIGYSDSEIDALSVPAWKKSLLKSLAHYGAYVQDTGGGGGPGFQFVSQQSYASYGAAGWNAFLGQSGVSGSTDSVAFDLDSGVDWSRLHAVDPCVASQSCASSAPAPIAGQGYHEVFRDDFNTLNRAVWDDHIWYDDPPSSTWTDFQTVESGVLHLRSRPNWTYPGCSSNCYPQNTATTHTANKTFQYGYFEARMNWTGGKGAWPAFWLISEGWADTGSCSTPAGEIDVMEGQGEEPNVLYGTVHKDSAGACSGHDQNGNNWQPQSFRLADNWHTYAAKWTPTTVTWYLDGVQTHSASTYADDNQPMHVLLQMWDGGWHDDADATSPNPLETQVDYVTVWQQ